MLRQIAAGMNPLEQLGTALAALPPGTLVALPREALLDLLGGPGRRAGGPVEVRVQGPEEIPAEVQVDLTVAELAQRFRRSPSTVRQWLESGQLEGYKLFGREWRVPAAAVVAFQERQRLGSGSDSAVKNRASLTDWRKVK